MVNFNKLVSKNFYKLTSKLFDTAIKYSKVKFKKFSIDISFVSKEKIKELNKEHRKIDKETDVLSFPMFNLKPFKKFDTKQYSYLLHKGEKFILLGDIVICEDVARENAVKYEHSYEREIFYLIVHGIFHLLGFDHENEDEKHLMRAAEEAVLNKFKIRN